MTKLEQEELEELGLTAEALAEKTAQISQATTKKRRTRSDKGVPKPKKAPEITTGAVTKEQANDIRDAMVAIVNARIVLNDAHRNLRLAEERFETILGSITKGA